MGLDMYLERKIYIGRDWEGKRKKRKMTIDTNLEGKKEIDFSQVKELVFDAGYWRKANAIHQWFVDNVQDGKDDCKDYYVSRDDLEKLLKIVNEVLENSKLVNGEVVNGYSFKDGEKIPNIEKGKVIKNPEKAKELLPTAEGFFFGSYDYDQWYYNDLVETKKILEKALKEKDGEFYYSSSW